MFFLIEQFFKDPKDFSEDIEFGILNIVDSLSDYHEEGRPLFPEIVFVTDIYHFQKKLPHLQKIRIGEFTLPIQSKRDFDKILKSCAPLALEGWVIYVEVNQYMVPLKVEYGLINAEADELSDTLYKQVLDDSFEIKKEMSCVFLRNIGQKTVRLEGLKDGELTLSFSAAVANKNPDDEIKLLAQHAAKGLKRGRIKTKVQSYLLKTIFNAINQGHGCLIGIVADDIENNVSNFNGHKLDQPLDFAALIEKAATTGDARDYQALRRNGFIISSAINNDGITILSKHGKLLGYHFIIRDDKLDMNTAGGARSQAFTAMKSSGKFICGFYKSQDGRTDIFTTK